MFERIKKLLAPKKDVIHVSLKEALLKSKTVISAYVGISFDLFNRYGQDTITQLSATLPQIREFLNPSVFSFISVVSSIATIYFYLVSNKVVKNTEVAKKDESISN